MTFGTTIATGPAPATPTASSGGREMMLRNWLGERPIVLVGMMGAGKTVVGRRLASRLGLPFIDSDHEIESCAQMSIAEIFARHGEPYFRDREHKVVSRLIGDGARVVATGGGSFIHQATRDMLKARCLSIWLKADFDVLMRRVRKRQNRPLLRTPDPEGTMRRLIETRYPIYAEADVTVESRDVPHEQVVEEILATLEARTPSSEAAGHLR